MEKFVAKMIALILCLSGHLSVFGASYNFKVDNIYYKINADKVTVNVTSTLTTVDPTTVNTDYTGNVVIPEEVEYNGKRYKVTGIDSFCTFKRAKSLRSIVLPSTITTLPNYAFYECSALNKVVLGENLEIIPDMCFMNCSSLSNIDIPEATTTIGKSAFSGCKALTSLIIPPAVNKIEESAFVGCTALSSIYFSDSKDLLRIGYGYYSGSNKGTFADCPLYDIYMGRNIQSLYTTNTGVFKLHPTLSEVTIGPKVTKIYESSFFNCNALTSVIIKEAHLEEIQDYAFHNCSNLSNINNGVLSSVTNIGEQAFSSCPKISVIYLPAIKTIGKNAFYSYEGSLETAYLGDNLEVIPEGCFSSQTNLKNVYIGNSVSTIENGAFRGCSKLTNMYLTSDKLTTLVTNAIPTTLSKIYVPNPSRYDNLLKDYYKDYLIIINPSSGVYSGKAPNFSYTNNVDGSSVSFESPNLNVNVGEYNTTIDVTFIIDEWKSIAKVPAKYSITPATLTVIADNVTRQYKEENPELTCSYFGFKNGETEEVLTNLPSVETTATQTSNVGTYPIIPFGAEAQNYTFTYERGTLTITKADQTIEWNQSFDNAFVGDIIELTATSSTGLPIKYSSTDESVAEIFTQNGKKHVEFLKAGKVSIRANQEGNENYNEADRVSKTITVEEKSGTTGITGVTDDNSDISIRRIGSSVVVDNARDSDVTVYSISGYILYQTVSYDSEEISLPAGLYLIKSGNRVVKFKI